MGLQLTLLVPDQEGLDIAYSSFADYRRYLARDAAGIDLATMKGFGGEGKWPGHDIQPLRHLLEHSDCDGWLDSYDCRAMVAVMRAFSPPEAWPEWMKRTHATLTSMVERCAHEGGEIKFN